MYLHYYLVINTTLLYAHTCIQHMHTWNAHSYSTSTLSYLHSIERACVEAPEIIETLHKKQNRQNQKWENQKHRYAYIFIFYIYVLYCIMHYRMYNIQNTYYETLYCTYIMLSSSFIETSNYVHNKHDYVDMYEKYYYIHFMTPMRKHIQHT